MRFRSMQGQRRTNFGTLGRVLFVTAALLGGCGDNNTTTGGDGGAGRDDARDGTSLLDATTIDVTTIDVTADRAAPMPDVVMMDVAVDTGPDVVVDAGCTNNAFCAGDPSGNRVCDVTTGRCVGCLPSSGNCTAGMYCDSAMNRCTTGCATDIGCAGMTVDGGVVDDSGVAAPLRCDTARHVCVQCLGDTDCPAGAVCMGSVCVPGCNATHDCPTSMSCCSGGCVDLQTNIAHCASCTTACMVANGMPACTAGACGIRSCTAPFADCNRMLADGCESNTATDVNNCGACGTVCNLPNATPTCTAGMCAIASCAAGFADCDGNPANGCEVNTTTDTGHCGSCTTACNLPNATQSCVAGMCAVASCNPGFSHCDTITAHGCETNTAGDVNNCGACRAVCNVPNATPGCSGGMCTVASCNAGFGDCDRNPANGCEVNTATSASNCGACGTACNLANAMASCTAGACTIAACAPGFSDCDGIAANGCEVATSSDPTNCGACRSVCMLPNAAAGCAGGTCTVASCAPGFGNCDGIAANGCETRTSIDPTNCGTCGNACNLPHATAGCTAGSCSITTCAAGYSDCDGNPANGCEVNTGADVRNCGGCGTVCSPPNATPTCSAGMCGIAACAPGFADCNRSVADGCEVNIASDVRNCGACGNMCAAANVTASTCGAGACGVVTCAPGFYDVDGIYANGCECRDDSNSHSCAAPTSIGTVATGGSVLSPLSKIILPGNDEWFAINFPVTMDVGTHVTGAPSISFAVNDGGVYRFEVRTNTCPGSVLGCDEAAGTTAGGVSSWSFVDNASLPGPNQWTSRNRAWPAAIFVRVFRTTPGTSCASFQLSVSR